MVVFVWHHKLHKDWIKKTGVVSKIFFNYFRSYWKESFSSSVCTFTPFFYIMIIIYVRIIKKRGICWTSFCSWNCTWMMIWMKGTQLPYPQCHACTLWQTRGRRGGIGQSGRRGNGQIPPQDKGVLHLDMLHLPCSSQGTSWASSLTGNFNNPPPTQAPSMFIYIYIYGIKILSNFMLILVIMNVHMNQKCMDWR